MEFEKDFDGWSRVKKETEISHRPAFYHEREIWWCTFGINVGHEQNGKGKHFLRPIVIIKKFNFETCICLPLTKGIRESRFHFPFYLNDTVPNTAILSQVRVIDTKRLVNKIGIVSKKEFEDIKQKLTRLFA